MKPETIELLRDAAEWRLISLLFECPSDEWRTQLAELSAEVTDRALKAAAKSARAEATPALYHTTFGPGGPAAPREVSHRSNVLPGQLLGELGALYQAFAYKPSSPEPPDHVAVEAGFLAYLRLKQAYAHTRGHADQAAVVAAAARRLIAGHLRTLAAPLAKSLRASAIRYLSQTAAAILKRTRPRRQRARSKIRHR